MDTIQNKVRKLVPQCLTEGAWLCFAGIDALNFHFTNSEIHTGIVELALISDKSFDGTPDFKKVSAMIIEELSKLMNETLLLLHSDERMVLTKRLLEKCSTSCFTENSFFEVNHDDPNRIKISFNSELHREKFTFIEIRIMENVTRTPFDRFGLRYLPLGFVYSDINSAQERYGGNDWKDREDIIKNTLQKKDITLSFWTTSEIAKECFPAVAFKKIGVAKPAIAKFEENLTSAPQIYSRQVGNLKLEINSEIADTKFTSLNLKSLIQRATYLGFFPDNTRFHDSLDNYFNNAILRELLTELIGSNH